MYLFIDRSIQKLFPEAKMNHEQSVQHGEATMTEEQRELVKVLYVWRRFTTGFWRYRKRGAVNGAKARRGMGGTTRERRSKGGKQEGRTKTYLALSLWTQ